MPKVNMFCGMVINCIIGPFFFQEATVTSDSYLDMLEHYIMLKLPCDTWF
jgi:hypothetical protein